MLIEWLEKNTDETVPGTDRVGEERLSCRGLLPESQRAHVPASPRLHVNHNAKDENFN